MSPRAGQQFDPVHRLQEKKGLAKCWLIPFSYEALLHRRVGSRAHDRICDVGNDRSVLFGFRERLCPLRVGPETSPRFFAVRHVVECEHVRETVIGTYLVRPEADHLHSVFLKVAHRNLGKTFVEGREFSGDRIIDAKFVNHFFLLD
jgi:hypothetical protein